MKTVRFLLSCAFLSVCSTATASPAIFEARHAANAEFAVANCPNGLGGTPSTQVMLDFVDRRIAAAVALGATEADFAQARWQMQSVLQAMANSSSVAEACEMANDPVDWNS